MAAKRQKTLQETIDEAAKAKGSSVQESEVISESEDVQSLTEEGNEPNESAVGDSGAAVGDASQGATADNAEPSVAHRFLQALGYDVEGVSEEQLVAEAKKRFEAFEKQAEPARIPEAETVASKEPVKQEPETPKQAESRRIVALAIDPSVNELIDYAENGTAIPREGSGEEGKEAAKQANKYMREYKDRLKKLGEDPIGFLQGSGLDEIIEQAVQKRLAEYDESQQRLRQVDQYSQRLSAEQQSIDRFFKEKEQELYVFGKDGKPKFIGQTAALSDFGADVKKEFDELSELAPSAPKSALLEKAYEMASARHKTLAQQPVKEDKKRKFLESGTPKVEPSKGSASPASVNDLVTNGASLLSIMLHDPSNEGNPAIAKMKASIN